MVELWITITPCKRKLRARLHQLRVVRIPEERKAQGPLAPFAKRILETVKDKLNRHLYNGRVEGYGKVLFPK